MNGRQRFKALGDWAQRTVSKAPNSGASGATGGFLIPASLIVGLDVAIREKSWFHKYARFQPMVTRDAYYPAVSPLGAAGRSPLLGGFTMEWVPEGSQPTESNPLFEQATLVAKDLGGFGYLSKQLFDDGGEPLGARLFELLAEAIAFYTTFACFRGTGVGEPLGVLNAPGTASVTRAGSGAIGATDIDGMLAKLLPASYPYSWWCASGGAAGKLSAVTGYNSNVVANPDGTLQTAGSLRGLPVMMTECLPPLGTAGDLVLMDPRTYVLGQRLDPEVAFAPDHPTAFANLQVAMRAWWRGDGQPLWPATMTTANSETGVSPVVILGAAA